MNNKLKISFFILLIITIIILIVSSLLTGRYTLSIADVYHSMLSLVNAQHEVSPQVKTVLFDIRLPRILRAFLVEGTLSITGATYQGMFHNPMVSPSILGVSAGSGFGVALFIVLGFGGIILQLTSFLFGILAVIMVYLISIPTGKKRDKCLTLILSGMIVGTVFLSLISILKYTANPDDTLPTIVYWLMGSLSGTEASSLCFTGILSLAGLVISFVVGMET